METALLLTALVSVPLTDDRPLLSDRLNFPGGHGAVVDGVEGSYVRRQWEGAEAALRRHDALRPCYEHTALAGRWEAEREWLEWSRRCWYALDDAFCPWPDQRDSLRQLRELLGDDLYYRGWMPPVTGSWAARPAGYQ